MFKLFTAPGACSLACDIVMEEAGVPFERKIVSFEKGETNTPEFLRMNPNGSVPVLETAPGQYITEGPAIMQFIAERAPESNLMPKTTAEKYKVLEWLNFTTSELHKLAYGNLWMAETFMPEEKAQEEFKKNVKNFLFEKLEIVNQKLEGKTFCIGNQYTIADSYLFTIIGWSRHLGVDLTKYKNVVNHQNRVYERSATQRAMKAEGLLK